MKTKTYRATAYKQGTDPETSWIVTFVVAAEELLDWAGIPRRTEADEVAGFQRGYDDKRVGKAKRFFEIPLNQSPTAIVIGLHPAPANDSESLVKLDFDDEDDDQPIRACTLSITYPTDFQSDQAVDLIRAQIVNRIGEVGVANDAAANDDDEVDADGEPDVDGEQDDDDSSEDEREIELGRSLLEKLARRLDDAEWCADHRDELLDLAKPATIIDGQHRVKGAERCERNIPFTVCALYDCNWAEQVFQFTVVNYTQKGIPDQFITNNAALSLTQTELGGLQDRLVQAGVNVVEYDLMRIVHFSDESPFKDLVNLTEKKDPHKIGYKTMVRVAGAWYHGRHQLFRVLLPALYPDLPGRRAHKDRVTRWREEDWGRFFLAFWTIVRDAYADKPSHEQGHSLWEVGHSNLVKAIVLFEFQAAFLDHLNGQDEEFFEPKSVDPEQILQELLEKVRRRARKFTEWFEPEFFATEWKQKSLSIGPGRTALQDTFTKLVTTKGNYSYVRSGLITGQTAG